MNVSRNQIKEYGRIKEPNLEGRIKEPNSGTITYQEIKSGTKTYQGNKIRNKNVSRNQNQENIKEPNSGIRTQI